MCIASKKMNYQCKCDPTILDNERERYAAQILLELPPGNERSRRLAAGLSSMVCIDPCIVEVIKELWSYGIETLGCCCGHNVINGYVDVAPRYFDLMKQLKYKKMPTNEYGHCELSFYL